MSVDTIGVGTGIGTPNYSSLQAWWDAIPATVIETETGKVLWASSANELQPTAMTTFSGRTIGAFSIGLTAEAGDSIVDSVGALRYDATRGACVSSTTTDSLLTVDNAGSITIDRLMFKKSGAYSSVLHLLGTSAPVVNNTIWCRTGINGDAVIRVQGGSITMNNFVVYTTESVSQAALWSSVGNNAIANGVVAKLGTAAATGVKRDYDSPVFTNVVSVGFTTDYSGTASASSTNNATDKAVFGGTNYGTSGQVSLVGTTEFENLTSGTEDFRIKSGSAKLKDNGTATGAPTTDFFGQARSGTTDIGAFELQAAAAQFPPWQDLGALGNYRRNNSLRM